MFTSDMFYAENKIEGGREGLVGSGRHWNFESGGQGKSEF